jgi:hypothetical protein
MTRYERYKNVSHFDLIEENKPVVLPSIFIFKSNEELYPFLAACRGYNCTVFFENEKLIIPPKDDINKTLEVFSYSVLITCPKIGDDYVRYVSSVAKSEWVQGEHEPILK